MELMTMGACIASEISGRLDGIIQSIYGIEVHVDAEHQMDSVCDHLGYLRDVLEAFALSHRGEASEAQSEMILRFVRRTAGIDPSTPNGNQS